MLLVASSIIMMDVRRRRARAKTICCLWPCEKLAPSTDTCVSSVMVILVSTSVAAMDDESPIISSVLTDEERDAVRDDAGLGVLGGMI